MGHDWLIKNHLNYARGQNLYLDERGEFSVRKVQTILSPAYTYKECVKYWCIIISSKWFEPRSISSSYCDRLLCDRPDECSSEKNCCWWSSSGSSEYGILCVSRCCYLVWSVKNDWSVKP